MRDMKEFEDARKEYEDIKIPKELNSRVLASIEKMKPQEQKKPAKVIYFKRAGIAVAACLSLLIIGLNTSETFAATAANIPVIGAICRVLTIRSFIREDETMTVNADTPELQVSDTSASVNEAVVDINQEISRLVEEKAQEAQKDIEDYKEAFIATGGTEEEFTQKDIHAKVSYEILSQDGTHVSFVIHSSQDWVSAYNESFFYNLDLTTGKMMTLKDVLGDDYKKIADASIEKQMKEGEQANDNIMYFGADEGGFAGVDDTTKFYINKAGNPVVYFEKYEVAPGSMGSVEFEIEK